MMFLTLLLIPLLIALGFFLLGRKQITWQEFAVHALVQVLVAGVSVALIYRLNTGDVETWNGQVTDKKHERVHCRHSYPCNPYPCNCNKDGCSTCWHTCYDHDYDIDWNVYSNIGEWTIDTVDSQGLKEPPRWTEVRLTDPVARNHSYTNYIKGASNTLFRYSGSVEKYKNYLPAHPNSIYDYYKVNRVVCVGTCPADVDQWNKDLAVVNSKVGYDKGANIILVFVGALEKDYKYALEQAWLGGKKNDIVVIMSLSDVGIVWVDVLAWTDNELFKVKIRDDLQALSKFERTAVLTIVSDDTYQYYKRKSMKDFEYLKASVTPTPGQWLFSMLFGFAASIGLGIYFYKTDSFN